MESDSLAANCSSSLYNFSEFDLTRAGKDRVKTIDLLGARKIIFNEPMLGVPVRLSRRYPDSWWWVPFVSLSQCAVLSCVICFQSILQIAMRLFCFFSESLSYLLMALLDGQKRDISKDRLSIRSKKMIECDIFYHLFLQICVRICIGSAWQSSFDLVCSGCDRESVCGILSLSITFASNWIVWAAFPSSRLKSFSSKLLS